MSGARLGRVLEAMRDRKISVCATIPTMVRALAAIDGAPAAFRALRVLRIGGDRLLGSDVALLTRLLSPDARILATFGMTEAGGTLMQRVIDPRQPIESGSIAVGWPVPDQEVTVADENGRPVAGGAAGELVIGGRNIALGHWIDGRLDRTAFVADPSIPDVRRYRTGDLVRVRPDGMFVPLGRLDRQAKINGLRIEPGETEAALRRHPGVADAVVLVDQGDGHARLVAFVVAAPGWSAGRLLPDLKPGVAACLPSQLVPGRIHLVPAIPLPPSLKPDVATLWRAARRTTAGGPLGRAWIRLRRTTSDRRAWTK
jgi:acyl-coenzyme A synthetase/AMP-(fatty) acid ligase